MLLGFLFEGGMLPQADEWIGMVYCRCLRGDFMFFIPSPLCHAFLPGNNRMNYLLYIIFFFCMAKLISKNEMHKKQRTIQRSWRATNRN